MIIEASLPRIPTDVTAAIVPSGIDSALGIFANFPPPEIKSDMLGQIPSAIKPINLKETIPGLQSPPGFTIALPASGNYLVASTEIDGQTGAYKDAIEKNDLTRAIKYALAQKTSS